MYPGEKLNSISHLVGAVLSLVGLGALLTIGIQSNDIQVLVSFTVFGTTMVVLYTMSTLYHSIESPQIKEFFRRLDRVAIYLLIAGTYAPFMMVSLGKGNGWLILGIVWGLAAFGMYSEFRFTGRYAKYGQLSIYLLMGWMGAIDIKNLHAALSSAGLAWLAAGGLFYTFGVVFYLLDQAKKMNHGHGIWHVFVLAGSICHFVAVIGYVR